MSGGNYVKRRDFLKLAGLTAGAGLLAACAQTAAPAPAATQAPKPAATTAPAPAATAKPAATQAPAAQQGTKTAVFWFNQPAQLDAFKLIVDRFHNAQNQWRLDVVLVPTQDLQTKLATAIAGGEPPDAARLHAGASLVSLFGDKGHLAPLEDWEPNLKNTDWVAGIKDAVTRNGKILAMPVNSGCSGFIWNQDLYKASGLDPEKPPKTLDELFQFGLKIVKPAAQIWGHYTLTAPISQTGGDYFVPVLWGYGGKEVSDDGKKVLYNSPEAVAAFQWYGDLVQKNKCMPQQQVNETQMLNAFLTGKVGSIFCYPAIVANIAKANFKSASTTIPAGPAGSKANLGFATIGVFAKAKNKEGGWAFAKFIGLDPDNMAFWNASFGQLPPRLSARDTTTWKEYQAKTPLTAGFLEGQKNAQLCYYGPGVAEIQAEVGKGVEAAVFAQKTAKQAADDTAAAAQVILDRELKKAQGS
ncbi:MAG: extracellular solute-binding protein [Chloroflexi bacterium]|nr:extracellular solute-binding protein [Chloroflexota bacterium]MCL5108533.1 extracellular solute-binding protein [Chloroflexota bacterium]